MTEYLPMLQEQQKWNKIRRNFSIGDVVFVVDGATQKFLDH